MCVCLCACICVHVCVCVCVCVYARVLCFLFILLVEDGEGLWRVCVFARFATTEKKGESSQNIEKQKNNHRYTHRHTHRYSTRSITGRCRLRRELVRMGSRGLFGMGSVWFGI